MLHSLDRKALATLLAAVREARRPPTVVGEPIEPTWGAAIGDDKEILASAVFRQGDSEDAVKAAWKQLAGKKAASDKLSLYLTLEPRTTYQRFAPVTESIRATGLRRVIIGTEDPFHRERGRGILALKNYGLEVVLADGEEARACQLLYEDYAKAMNRFVPLLKLVCELREEERGRFSVHSAPTRVPDSFDAVLVDLNALYRKDLNVPKGAWIVVLDSYAGVPLDSPVVREFSRRMIACVAKLPDVEAKLGALRKAGIQVLSVPPKDARVDLALVLRQVRDLGFLALYAAEGKELWHGAIQAGLVDSILCHVKQEFDPVRALSDLEKAKIEYAQGGAEPLEFRLARPRWIESTGSGFWVEAQILELAAGIG